MQYIIISKWFFCLFLYCWQNQKWKTVLFILNQGLYFFASTKICFSLQNHFLKNCHEFSFFYFVIVKPLCEMSQPLTLSNVSTANIFQYQTSFQSLTDRTGGEAVSVSQDSRNYMLFTFVDTSKLNEVMHKIWKTFSYWVS